MLQGSFFPFSGLECACRPTPRTFAASVTVSPRGSITSRRIKLPTCGGFFIAIISNASRHLIQRAPFPLLVDTGLPCQRVLNTGYPCPSGAHSFDGQIRLGEFLLVEIPGECGCAREFARANRHHDVNDAG